MSSRNGASGRAGGGGGGGESSSSCRHDDDDDYNDDDNDDSDDDDDDYYKAQMTPRSEGDAVGDCPSHEGLLLQRQDTPALTLAHMLASFFFSGAASTLSPPSA